MSLKVSGDTQVSRVINRGKDCRSAPGAKSRMASMGLTYGRGFPGYWSSAEPEPGLKGCSYSSQIGFLRQSLENRKFRARKLGRMQCNRTTGYSKWSERETRKKSHSQTLEDGNRVPEALQLLQVGNPGVASEEVQHYLEKIYNAMGLQDYNGQQHIVASGVQVLMGMEGQWKFTWNMDGRFHERYKGLELYYEWAYDGHHEPWCADAAGRVSSLDLDDREVCLLASWIRTGYWITEEGKQQLCISVESSQKTDVRQTTLKVQLTNTKVLAYVVVENSTWLPARMSIKAFGSEDNWKFEDWQPIFPGHGSQFAKAVVHNPPAGGVDVYSVTHVKLENFADELVDKRTGIGAVYAMPTSKVVKRSTRSYPQTAIDNELHPSVMMLEAASGHFLVKPLVDGKDIGYFIVDTGASSLTIAPRKAEELAMYEFGETYVTGIEGQVKCQFRRAKSFQVGPLTITDPIFMEVPMAGVVRGVSPDAVAGICGYDVFFHCVVEMSYKNATLSLYDPLLYNKRVTSEWQTMHILENVPHVPAQFNGIEAIFLLDTGAGGVDIIFHARAVKMYRLDRILKLEGTACVKGINSSGTGLQVQYGVLDTLQVAGQSFRKVKALVPSLEACGSLEFSEYTAGVLCGDLLQSLLIGLDYGNRRFAFLDSEDGDDSSLS